MKGLFILNSREKRKTIKEIGVRYGLDEAELKDMVLLIGEGFVWAAGRDCVENLRSLPVSSLGIPIADEKKKEPTIHCIQLFFNNAWKRAVNLDRKQAEDFIDKKPVSLESELSGRVLVKNEGRALDIGQLEDGILRRRS
ncbi:MAG: hypothetical protein ABIH11_02875 [Candidatus Altiarchaeota archaeon]